MSDEMGNGARRSTGLADQIIGDGPVEGFILDLTLIWHGSAINPHRRAPRAR